MRSWQNWGRASRWTKESLRRPAKTIRPRRSTAATAPPSPPTSCTSWSAPSRSPTIQTCTAGRSWPWRSTFQRFESRWDQAPQVHTDECVPSFMNPVFPFSGCSAERGSPKTGKNSNSRMKRLSRDSVKHGVPHKHPWGKINYKRLDRISEGWMWHSPKSILLVLSKGFVICRFFMD